MDSLELLEFNVLHIEENTEYRIYEVEAKKPPHVCPNCNKVIIKSSHNPTGEGFKLKDTRIRTVKDVNDIWGHKVIVKINQHRYTCPACGKPFTEVFFEIERRDGVTCRLADAMAKEVLKERSNTFALIARKYGVSDTTVRNAFKKLVKRLDEERILKAPKVLGIDEVYVTVNEHERKIPLCVFTDIEKHQILEITDKNDRDTVISVIKSMLGWENIEQVTMDMNPTYRNAVKMCLPKAFCVIDHFHVIQKFNMSLNLLRSDIQSKLGDGDKKALYSVKGLIIKSRDKIKDDKLFPKLDGQLELYPSLKTAYWFKEMLRDVYKSESKREAYERYSIWEEKIFEAKKNKEDVKVVVGVQRMINRLKNEVFAFFDGGNTNSYTERFNRFVKDMIRLGNGYQFETIRARVLYTTAATKQEKWKDMHFERIQFMAAVPENLGKEHEYAKSNELLSGWGVDIDELCDAIEQGEI